jgi:hypothetical protein
MPHNAASTTADRDIVHGYIIVSERRGIPQHGSWYYARKDDAEADAAVYAKEAPKTYEGDPRGVPSFSVEWVSTSRFCLREGQRFPRGTTRRLEEEREAEFLVIRDHMSFHKALRQVRQRRALAARAAA